MKKTQLGWFYLPPKIRKHRSNVPGRPVISDNGAATENISSFLDFHLKTIIRTIPHILEGTSDFLSRLNQLRDTPDTTLLVTFDVVGLYPHVPHEEGLETIDTTIGTKLVPHYANIFMARLEQEICSNTEFQLLLWLRYMDNICCLWTDTIEKLNEFLQFLNAFHPSIKFATDYSPYEINYLDVLMNQMNQGKPCVQVYIRNPLTPTNIYTHNLVAVPYIKGQYPIAKLFEWNEYVLKGRIYDINWGIWNSG